MVFDKEGGTDEENQANQEFNDQNQKYHDRLALFFDDFLPKVLVPTAWSINHRQQQIISNFEWKETNKDIVPVEAEAMAILYIENNQDKWEFQASAIKKSKAAGYEAWLKKPQLKRRN